MRKRNFSFQPYTMGLFAWWQPQEEMTFNKLQTGYQRINLEINL